MAFSAWQILSPVQWARWTWSAVRGGGSPEDGDGGAAAAEEDDEEDDRDPRAGGSALGFRQVPFPRPPPSPRRCRLAPLRSLPAGDPAPLGAGAGRCSGGCWAAQGRAAGLAARVGDAACPWRPVLRAQLGSEQAEPPAGLRLHRALLAAVFHLLSLLRLPACPAGQQREAARMPTASPGPGWTCRRCGDCRGSLESGNSSLFSPPSAARTPLIILRPLKQKHQPARHSRSSASHQDRLSPGPKVKSGVHLLLLVLCSFGRVGSASKILWL